MLWVVKRMTWNKLICNRKFYECPVYKEGDSYQVRTINEKYSFIRLKPTIYSGKLNKVFKVPEVENLRLRFTAAAFRLLSINHVRNHFIKIEQCNYLLVKNNHVASIEVIVKSQNIGSDTRRYDFLSKTRKGQWINKGYYYQNPIVEFAYRNIKPLDDEIMADDLADYWIDTQRAKKNVLKAFKILHSVLWIINYELVDTCFFLDIDGNEIVGEFSFDNTRIRNYNNQKIMVNNGKDKLDSETNRAVLINEWSIIVNSFEALAEELLKSKKKLHDYQRVNHLIDSFCSQGNIDKSNRQIVKLYQAFPALFSCIVIYYTLGKKNYEIPFIFPKKSISRLFEVRKRQLLSIIDMLAKNSDSTRVVRFDTDENSVLDDILKNARTKVIYEPDHKVKYKRCIIRGFSQIITIQPEIIEVLIVVTIDGNQKVLSREILNLSYTSKRELSCTNGNVKDDSFQSIVHMYLENIYKEPYRHYLNNYIICTYQQCVLHNITKKWFITNKINMSRLSTRKSAKYTCNRESQK